MRFFLGSSLSPLLLPAPLLALLLLPPPPLPPPLAPPSPSPSSFAAAAAAGAGAAALSSGWLSESCTRMTPKVRRKVDAQRIADAFFLSSRRDAISDMTIFSW